MALAMLIFSVVDTGAKLLTESFHAVQIVWFRQLGLLVGVLLFLPFGGLSILKTAHPGLQIARGALAVCSATTFIIALTYVQLADAVAVSFVAPFMVTILGATILGERVGIRRWTAVTIGFVGALIVIRPGFGVMHPAIFFVVAAALFFALRQILSRYLAGGDRTITTVAYTAITASALLLIPLPFFWQTHETASQIGLLAGVAILAATGESLMIKALEVTQAVIIAPVQYLLLIFSTTWGYLVFGYLPDGWTWAGALVIVATGIYTLSRERRAAQPRDG